MNGTKYSESKLRLTRRMGKSFMLGNFVIKKDRNEMQAEHRITEVAFRPGSAQHTKKGFQNDECNKKKFLKVESTLANCMKKSPRIYE